MPMDRGELDEQLQSIGEGSRWWDTRELRDLPGLLHREERILALVRGKVGRVRVVRKPWLVVVTDHRLLCVRSARHAGWKQFEVSADQVRRVALRIGLFRGRVLLATGGDTYRVLAPRAEAYKLYAAVSSLTRSNRDSLQGFGPTRMVRRVFDHVLGLPAAAFGPDREPARAPQPADTSLLDRRVELLEEHINELQRQVEFLEDLLRRKHLPPGTGTAAFSASPPAPTLPPGQPGSQGSATRTPDVE
jgi:hypothetical protein